VKNYFDNFCLVELNSIFYRHPQERTVEGWREKASQDFEFTVEMHQ
jgi:uncharacterized protein YecE (DUF72 family)